MNLLISYDLSSDEYWRVRFSDVFGQDHEINSFKEIAKPGLYTEEYVKSLTSSNWFTSQTAVVVLIGPKTYSSSRVDWEVSSALKPKTGRPTPLLALRLPTHSDHGRSMFNPSRIPARLADNIKSGYLGLYDWTESDQELNRLLSRAARTAKEKNDDADNKRKLMLKDMFG